MIRRCRVCEATFEIPPEELIRLQKEGLAIPHRCPDCTRRGQRFATMAAIWPKHDLMPLERAKGEVRRK